MRAIVTAAALFAASSAGADSVSRALEQALGLPEQQHFDSRANCLQELSRAIRQLDRSTETNEMLIVQIAEREDQLGARDAIAALQDQVAASERYVSALMNLCQSY